MSFAPKVFLTRLIPDEGIFLLKKAGFSLDVYEKDQIIPRGELLKRVVGCDALLSLLTDKIDEDVMKAAGPNLKVIANYAVGFDNVDVAAAQKRTIIVTNAPAPEVSITVAEHTMALLMGLARRLVEADRFARAKKYKGWSPTLLLGSDLRAKTIGIIGMGHIGREVAKRAVHGFGMRCVYTSTRHDEEVEHICHATFLSLERLLETADFITLHLPLSPHTRHLISTAEFSLMKKSAFLINTARGPIIDEEALLRALATKRIAGAALDVFENEPEVDFDLQGKHALKSFENVILTPHIASASIEARQAMSRLAAENIVSVLRGKGPLNPATERS
jgi:glyoxylate reductase